MPMSRRIARHRPPCSTRSTRQARHRGRSGETGSICSRGRLRGLRTPALAPRRPAGEPVLAGADDASARRLTRLFPSGRSAFAVPRMAALTPKLPRVAIGRDGLEVTTLIFGGAPIGGLFEAVEEDVARATLEAAWAAGVRAFDTAPHYGVGLSERRLGAFLADRRRDEFVLCTKVGRLLVATDDDVAGVDEFHGTPQLARMRDYTRDGVLA